MKSSAIVFPHQLFENNPLFEEDISKIYLIEDPLFFKDRYTKVQFQKKKLLLHRASMKWYESYLTEKGYEVEYIEYDGRKTTKTIVEQCAEEKFICVNPVDFLLEKRLLHSNKKISFLETPYFINSEKVNNDFLSKGTKLLMQSFYIEQRKRLDILIDMDGKPKGGSWSFDKKNREKLPKGLFKETPDEIIYKHTDNELPYIDAASEYVDEHFKNTLGTTDSFLYPITHESAKTWLQNFFEKSFEKFGPYEDAFTSNHKILFHSVLTPMLNIGLLTPKYIVEQAILFAEQNDVPIHSLEGFIRQIIGWREYMRMIYINNGSEMRTSNYWNFENTMPEAFYDGTSNLEPVDTVIKNVLSTGYAHHIERLMVLGNIMLLLEISPDQIYKWFMELFIDSCDWVMVPNVYAMSQYADGGMVTTKPYISSSNYIRKMSNYEKGEWCTIWDALYWSFICKHLKELKSNGRMHFVVSRAEKFSSAEKAAYTKTANEFKKELGLQ